MFYKKKGLPEEEEFVICTAKKILPHAVFLSIDEYENLEGMLHISEVSPGRIRSLGDYVKVGKRIVCKVLRVDREKRHVDLSLRRVPLALKIKKNEGYKQEQKAEKILELVGAKLKKDLRAVYGDIGYKIVERFGSLHTYFTNLVNEEDATKKELELPKDYATLLTEMVKERIKPPRVSIKGALVLKSPASNGIVLIKKALKGGMDIAKKEAFEIKVSYVGAPKYEIEIVAPNYKEAEESLKKVITDIINSLQKDGGSGEFIRK